jgi:hypothetical protein
MAQKSQVIDLTKSYIPGDPNTVMENLVSTQREDGEEKTLPIVPYEGYNFLPTSYGYRSYFGTNARLQVEALASRAQYILTWQTSDYKSWLVALCEDGIWVVDATIADAAWVQSVVHSFDADVFESWSYCVIENKLFCYKQGGAEYYTSKELVAVDTLSGSWSGGSATVNTATAHGLTTGNTVVIAGVVPAGYNGTYVVTVTDADTFTYTVADPGGVITTQGTVTNSDFILDFDSATPSFLNMDGQMGIFKAGTRLGFWDSANSIAWSSNFEFDNFTPSIETTAGNATFSGITGRIVTIKSNGDGYVIYATRSIVGVKPSLDSTIVWDAATIFTDAGVSHVGSVTTGANDSEHYAYTTSGIAVIGKYNALEGKYANDFVMPEIFDFLREMRDPVHLQCIHGRFLMFMLTDPAYIYGQVSHVNYQIDPRQVSVRFPGGYWDGNLDSITVRIPGNLLITMIEQTIVRNVPYTQTQCFTTRTTVRTPAQRGYTAA